MSVHTSKGGPRHDPQVLAPGPPPGIPPCPARGRHRRSRRTGDRTRARRLRKTGRQGQRPGRHQRRRPEEGPARLHPQQGGDTRHPRFAGRRRRAVRPRVPQLPGQPRPDRQCDTRVRWHLHHAYAAVGIDPAVQRKRVLRSREQGSGRHPADATGRRQHLRRRDPGAVRVGQAAGGSTGSRRRHVRPWSNRSTRAGAWPCSPVSPSWPTRIRLSTCGSTSSRNRR
jgi:hypothetical protein